MRRHYSHRNRKVCVFNGQSNIRTTTEAEPNSSTRPPTNYLETPFVDSQGIQENSEEQTEDYGIGWLQYQAPGRLSFVEEYYE